MFPHLCWLFYTCLLCILFPIVAYPFQWPMKTHHHSDRLLHHHHSNPVPQCHYFYTNRWSRRRDNIFFRALYYQALHGQKQLSPTPNMHSLNYAQGIVNACFNWSFKYIIFKEDWSAFDSATPHFEPYWILQALNGIVLRMSFTCPLMHGTSLSWLHIF
ncbi:hypothetical protein Salat_2780600 [Sesamum alatum]|uniref:Secreted protein n=1 Tax=Sesamum alatum TaxID=300844 RepID=A0AAE1XKT8_9LAMI|nr:hypothetical protein Salat_2780600 [Sesamum alatum]